MKTYRTGFLFALLGNLALAILLGALWLHYRALKPALNTAPDASTAAGQPAAESSEAPLVPIQLSPERLQSIGVQIGTVERKLIADEIHTTGNVVLDESKLAYVQVRFSGYIEKTFVNATYQYVRKGQPLFTIYSPELVATEREYLVAKQNQQQIASSTVPGVASSAASLLQATTERLKQWGIPEQELSRLDSTGQVQRDIEFDSPVSGYVTERNALSGVAVQPETRLYTVADMSTVWVQAQVLQNDLAKIKTGAPATLTLNTFPARAFNGRIDFVYPAVDMETRTAKVRIIVPNQELQLKPGMFVNVTLRAPMGRQLVIPSGGILQSGTRQIAFVQRRDGYLEPREVEVGARVGDEFVVLKGLTEGEQIATSANFLIDSESQLQAALGSLVPPPAGAGAGSNSSAASANAELTFEPDPPHKGANVLRIKLTDANGSLISGAEVTVTFFMPAMPAMGMAAMRTPVTLSDKGNGIYEGSGVLGSGGTWQTTILAKRNGQTIATKQVSVNATGGM